MDMNSKEERGFKEVVFLQETNTQLAEGMIWSIKGVKFGTIWLFLWWNVRLVFPIQWKTKVCRGFDYYQTGEESLLEQLAGDI